MKQEYYMEWQSRLIELDAAQRADLMRRLQQFGADPAAPDYGDDWLFPGICSSLIAAGMLTKISTPMLMRSPSYQRYKRVAGALLARLDHLIPPNQRRSGRSSLALLVGSALIRRCKRQNRVTSAGKVLTLAPQALEALEECFPGYINANLFSMVLDSRVKPIDRTRMLFQESTKRIKP